MIDIPKKKLELVFEMLFARSCCLPRDVEGFQYPDEVPFVETSMNRQDSAIYETLLMVFLAAGQGMMMLKDGTKADEIRQISQASLRAKAQS